MRVEKSRISVCICTYRRQRLLERLLEKIAGQITHDEFTYSVVVVDNDAEGSGREVVMRMKGKCNFTIQYHLEPHRSISHARNRSVAGAEGDMIAFIDDDEFPADDWLLQNHRSLLASEADGVLGPVLPHFETPGPAWLVRSGLLDRVRFKSGEVISSARYMRTGNVLLWRRLFADGGFDPKYGLSGSGDTVFFKRKMETGCVFIWCDEALVYETVPLERQRRSYYLRRACTRGMTEAWQSPFLSRGTLKSAVAVLLYTAALPFLGLFGQHVFMRYLVKSCDHLGKLLAYINVTLVRERPYQEASLPSA